MKRRFGYRFFFWMLVVLLPVSAAASSQPVTAQGWVRRVIAAYGGRQALEKVHTIVYKGRIVALLGNDHGKETISLQRPDRLRTSVHYSRSSDERILNGKDVWSSFGGDFQKTTGAARLAVIYQYQHLDLPMGLLGDGYQVTLGVQEIDGRKYPVLDLSDVDGPPMRVIIDPDTGLIRRVSGIFKIQGQTTQLAVDYGDYRKVGPIPLPHRMINYAGGVKIAEADFDQVKINEPLPANLFHP
jgi:hypothetical protein